MRSMLISTLLAIALSAVSSQAMAVKTRTLTGAAIGAGVGAAVAGPPGAVVGGVGGAIIGGPNLPPYRHCWVRHGVRHCSR